MATYNFDRNPDTSNKNKIPSDAKRAGVFHNLYKQIASNPIRIIITCSILMLIAIGVIVFFAAYANNTDGYAQVIATIVDIEILGDSNTVFVSFDVNDTHYERIRIMNYDATMYVGKQVTIWYYINNPEDTLHAPKILDTANVVIPYAVAGTFVAVTGTGVGIGIYALAKHKKDLKANQLFDRK